jgi:hypothetical protein
LKERFERAGLEEIQEEDFLGFGDKEEMKAVEEAIGLVVDKRRLSKLSHSHSGPSSY